MRKYLPNLTKLRMLVGANDGVRQWQQIVIVKRETAQITK
jgi:hypothetical protein